jgi:hypothetical protein
VQPLDLTVVEPGSVNPPGLFGGIAGQALTLNVGTLTLAAASRTITYQARVRATAPPGVAQTNTVVAKWAIVLTNSGSFTRGQAGAVWTLVAINAGTAPTIAPVDVADTLPLTLRLCDPIPGGLTYFAGSLSCQPAGSTTVTGCVFDAATNRVVVDARLGPDTGNVNVATANYELVVVFRTLLSGLGGTTTNIASVAWDANSTGTVDDDTGQVPVTARASITVAIPIDARWMLTLLATLLAGLGLGAVCRKA